LHGFTAALTSFVGRAGEVEEVARLVGEYRLVTVTGPGGVGKTRLACELTRRLAGRFADGVWLVELARVQAPALVEAAVSSALGVRQAPGMSLLDSLVAVLARRQLLLVLDSCEHVAAVAAELCGALLVAADDMRVLATSREPLGIAGEARYRLRPLGLSRSGDPAEAAEPEAVALFADRARRVDPHFTLSGESGPAVTRLVARLDGMPLAIELAAARVEALGVAQLAGRLDDRFALLTGTDRLAAARHRSLAATVEWSYQLLGEQERQVFRRLAVFPSPFTLEAAEAVAGVDAGQAVLHLVDCSMLSPPATGPDGRARYAMLETLRAYGANRLGEAGEQPEAAARLASLAVWLAEQAAAGLETSAGEMDAARRLDAEDATLHNVLAWGLEHDPPTAVRLAVSLAPWWVLRGRWVSAHQLMSAAIKHAAEGGQRWCTAQFWLGLTAFGIDTTAGLGHFTAVRDALAQRAPSPLLCLALTGRAACLANLGRVREAEGELGPALALAQEIGDPVGEAYALIWLAIAAYYSDELQTSLAWSRQAQRIDTASLPGWMGHLRNTVLVRALTETGELAAAGEACTRGLVEARQAGALYEQSTYLHMMTRVALQEGRLPEAAAYLREAIGIAAQLGGNLLLLPASLDTCGHLCAQTQRPADAVTAWAAHAACEQRIGMPSLPHGARRRQEPLREARQALGPAAARAAEERGAAMGLAAAAEYVVLLVSDDDTPRPASSPATPGLPRLSARERELVTLVAQGRTDAQIAGQLYISVRTVRSHLDRIRDKTGCRRRADLTRLALQAGLV
jgi:non-specific serine/threonine protein kinase